MTTDCMICMICWLKARHETEEVLMLAAAILGRVVEAAVVECFCDRHQMQFVAATGLLAGVRVDRAPPVIRSHLQGFRDELDQASGVRAENLRLIAATVAELEEPSAASSQLSAEQHTRGAEDAHSEDGRPSATPEQIRRIRDLHISRHRPRR